MAHVRDNKRLRITMTMRLVTKIIYNFTGKTVTANKNVYVTARALEERHWQNAEDKLHKAIATRMIKDIHNLPGGIILHVKFRINVP